MFKKLDERTLASALLATSVIAGLTIPTLASMFAPYALSALFFVVVLSLVPFAHVPTDEIVSVRGPSLRLVVWQQFILPGIVIALAVVAKLPESFVILAIITATSGSVFASPAIAEMLHLDRKRALQGMVLSTLLTPLSLFLYLNIFRDAASAVTMAGYLQRMVIFLVVPFLVFAGYRAVIGRLSETVVETINVSSRWGVLVALMVFCIGIMAAVSAQLVIDPTDVLVNFIMAGMLCAGMLFVTAIVMYRFGRKEALTAGLLSGFRNVGLGYALIGESMGHDLAVYVGISMLPMFVTPLVIRLHHVSRHPTIPHGVTA
jgi:BASS family bile acid:Na+ symporter